MEGSNSVAILHLAKFSKAQYKKTGTAKRSPISINSSFIIFLIN